MRLRSGPLEAAGSDFVSMIPQGVTTRIASTIVTGIGFIGAGAILRGGQSGVIGLTTAATLWMVTGLGIAVGMGFYFEAIVTTGLVFFTFLYLSKIVDMVRLYAKKHPPKPLPEEEHEL